MPVLNPKPGNRYLTATGAPIQVLEVHTDGIVSQSLASDNQIAVPVSYPFGVFNKEKAAVRVKPRPYWKQAKCPKSPPPKGGDLAFVIDALLLDGDRTMRGLVREVKRRASSACKGKNVAANVRARIYWLRRKGYTAKRNGQGHIKVFPYDKPIL